MTLDPPRRPLWPLVAGAAVRLLVAVALLVAVIALAVAVAAVGQLDLLIVVLVVGVPIYAAAHDTATRHALAVLRTVHDERATRQALALAAPAETVAVGPLPAGVVHAELVLARHAVDSPTALIAPVPAP